MLRKFIKQFLSFFSKSYDLCSFIIVYKKSIPMNNIQLIVIHIN